MAISRVEILKMSAMLAEAKFSTETFSQGGMLFGNQEQADSFADLLRVMYPKHKDDINVFGYEAHIDEKFFGDFIVRFGASLIPDEKLAESLRFYEELKKRKSEKSAPDISELLNGKAWLSYLPDALRVSDLEVQIQVDAKHFKEVTSKLEEYGIGWERYGAFANDLDYPVIMLDFGKASILPEDFLADNFNSLLVAEDKKIADNLARIIRNNDKVLAA